MFLSTAKLFNAGLGNLLIPMSKAYLASRALNCRLLIPIRIDTRRMKSYFNPIKMGYFPYLPNPLKKITFTHEDYKNIIEITKTNDYYKNVKAFVERNSYKNIILINEGMWGGYYSIYKARKWIKTFLTASRRTRKNISETGSYYHADRVQVAIHIRKGDFEVPTTYFRPNNENSIWNVQIPIEWYYQIAEKLIKEIKSDNIDFVLFTDSLESHEINVFAKRFNVITNTKRINDAFGDLYLMSECDLIVCANSSFSMMSTFLSEAPYIMYKEYMIKKDGKYYMWDEEIFKYDLYSENAPRGSLIGDDEKLGDRLLLHLKNKLKERNSIHKELIFGGKYSGAK